MDNEATLEKIGDSKTTATVSTEEAICEEHTQTEAAVECSNGVCVLNWKPNRAA